MVDTIGSEFVAARRGAFERRSKFYVPIHVAVCVAAMSLPAFGFIDRPLFSLTQRLPPSRFVPTLIAEAAYLLPLVVGVLVCCGARPGDRWAWTALWIQSLTGAVLGWVAISFGQLLKVLGLSGFPVLVPMILGMVLCVFGLFFRGAWFEILLPRACVDDPQLRRRLDWTATVLCAPACFIVPSFFLFGVLLVFQLIGERRDFDGGQDAGFDSDETQEHLIAVPLDLAE